MSAPYGLWPSPITPRMLAEDRRLEAARWDSDGGTLVWLEGRSGRGVLLAQQGADNAPRELTADHDVRAEVGYGGGDFAVHRGWVYFVGHKTGRIYRQPLVGGHARPITPPFGKAASPTVSPDGRWLAYVHHDEEGTDRLAVVDSEGSHWPQVLVAGQDFYMQPCWSPDGRQLAWIAWDHPAMPWDSTQLYLATVEYRSGLVPQLGHPQVIAGGPEVAVQQPEFTPDGRQLLYVSDETGWGRIAAFDLVSGRRRWLTPDGVEHGIAAWGQGMRTFALSHDSQYLVAVRNERGFHRIRRIALSGDEDTAIPELSHYTEAAQIVLAPDCHRLAFAGSGPTTPLRIVEHDLAAGSTRIVARASAETVLPQALARCEALAWTSTEGETVHGLYYSPAHAPADTAEVTGTTNTADTLRPPLVVLVHGGPTSQARAGWNPQAQFFATRGYAVLLVNYRGSTGYGRAYMARLRGQWGVCDVEDAVSGARHLADTGRVDPARTVIMGGSAGGFTVLQTLIDYPEAFAAGICMYGVANQFHLAAETHKFEAHYLDSLLGPLPQAAAVYRQRSPVLHAAKIRRPVAVFQGDADRVVPKPQSDLIVEALRRNGTPHVYHVYEGEGHGWRKSETIEHFYRAVESFLRTHVLFA